MKNVLSIMKHDLKKITGSVVAIITVLGLCLVPCLYAWFNIFSNWSPYESDATGRISVAVANMDLGANAAGLKINVGDKIIEALEANDDIGWVFVDSESEAIDGVFASDYYAALIVPEDFSADVLSFMDGYLINPKLMYYENEKKNAIAPKITGKAKTAVQEQVNATFVETLAGYVSDAASIAEASGTDPSKVLSDLADKVDAAGRDLDSAIALSDSAAGLTEAAGSILDVSGILIGSTQDVIDSNDSFLRELDRSIPKRKKAQEAEQDASKSNNETSSELETLKKDVIDLMSASRLAFNNFVRHDRDGYVKLVDKLQKNAAAQSEAVNKEGFTVLGEEFTELADKLGEISADLTALSTDMTEEERTAALTELSNDIDDALELTDKINAQIRSDIDTNLSNALANTHNSIASLRKSLASANKELGKLSSGMGKYQSSVRKLKSSIDATSESLKSLQDGTDVVSGAFGSAAGNELLRTMSDLLANDEAAVAEYLANPVKMDTEVVWEIRNYGSAMAPFYTVLAQWVGALLTAVLIKVKIKRREEFPGLKLRQWFFGRYGLYMLVGLTQGLVVSLGDVLYIGIQCPHPLLFVLAACVNGLVFMMINYALVFALDNIGLGAGVIILVLQVAGSGGTYPVEVLPGIFQTLYPLMPFRYAMDAMRECIAGMYGDTYWRCLGILMVFFVFFTALGLAFYRPMLRLNNMIAESKAKSEIML